MKPDIPEKEKSRIRDGKANIKFDSLSNALKKNLRRRKNIQKPADIKNTKNQINLND